MKILIIFSGSFGHFLGISKFMDHMALKEEVLYASHIPSSQKNSTLPEYLPVKAPPAFLDYEFLHLKDKAKIIEFKDKQVYYHARKAALQQLIEKVNPDVIIQDNHSFTDALIIAELFRESTIKMIFYQTRLSTALDKNSLYGGCRKKNFRFLKSSILLRRKKYRRWRKRIMMPGLNESHNIKQLMNRLHLKQVTLNNRRAGLDSLYPVPEIILSGKDLSFYNAPNQLYAGLSLSRKHHQKEKDPLFIHVSMGSGVPYSNNNFAKYFQYINLLLNHFSDLNFSLPHKVKEIIRAPNARYYKFHEYKDHLAVSSVHITMGGINSIKDSMDFGVPMLNCPMIYTGDGPHNALMFERLGLSHTWNIMTDDIEVVKIKIKDLIEGDFQDRIKNYVTADQEMYPVEKVRAKFMELVNDERWEIANW